MTGRERIESALSSAGSSEFAAAIPYTGIFLRDHFSQVTDAPWWAPQSVDMTLLRKVQADLIAAVPQDWIQLPMGPSRDERERTTIQECADGVYRCDRTAGTSQLISMPQVGGKHLPTSRCPNPPRTPEDIDRLITIPTRKTLLQPFEEGRGDLADELLRNEASDLFPIGRISSPVWGLIGVWPFEEFMTQLIDNTELIEYAVARRTERITASVPVFKRHGCRGVWIEDCWTDMLSPAQWRRFNLPGLRALTAALRAEGLYSIHYYCGNPNDRMDLLLETGADALSLEEGKKGFDVDIARIAEHVDGRMCLLGNLDSFNILERGSDDQLRDEIARQLAAGRRNRGRFIMSLGSPVTPGTPLSRVRDYLRLARA